MKPQVYKDPRPAEHFDRFHERQRAKRRRLRHLGHDDRHPQHVRLELHQPAVHDGAAVGLQLLEPDAGRPLHRPHRVDGLVGHRLQRSAGEVRAPRSTRQSHERAAGVRVPVRRAEAGEGGDEVDAVVRVERAGELLGLVGGPDDPQLVAQPLDGGAGHEDRRLERVVDPVVHPPRDRREQAFGGRGHLLPGVLEHKASSAVRVLAEARLVAGLAVERRLLVARYAGHRHRAAELGRLPVHVRAGARLGE